MPIAPFVGVGCPGLIAEDGAIERGGHNLPGGVLFSYGGIRIKPSVELRRPWMVVPIGSRFSPRSASAAA